MTRPPTLSTLEPASSLPVASWLTLGALALLLLWTGLVYLQPQSLQGEFLYDDNPFIVRNEQVHRLDQPWRFFFSRDVYAISDAGDFKIYRPLASLGFALNYHFNRLDPFPFHLTNVLFHLADVVLLFLLLRLLFRADLPALAASLLFALHPRNVEAVTWIASFGNVLFLFFFLGGFLCHLGAYRPGARGWLLSAGSILAYALAVLSKEMAITYPAVLILFDWLLRDRAHRPGWRRYLVYYGALAAVGVAYLVARTLVVHDVSQTDWHGGTFLLNLLFAVKCVAEYVLMTLWPVALSIVYTPHLVTTLADWTFWLSLPAVIATAGAVFLLRRRTPLVAFGLAFYLVTVLPVSQVIPIKTTVNDRFLYLPMIGLVVAVCAGVVHLLRWTRANLRVLAPVAAVLLVVLAFFSVQTVRRNRVWTSYLDLFSDALRKYPTSGMVLSAMGRWYLDQGQTKKAIELFEQAAAGEGTEEGVLLMLAKAHADNKNFQRAREVLQMILAHSPRNAVVTMDLAAMYHQLGQLPLAEQTFRRAIELDPKLPRCYFQLARLLMQMGRPPEALDVLARGHAACPSDYFISLEFGRFLLDQHQPERAAQVWEQALKSYPSSPDLMNNLAWLYVTEKGPLHRPVEGLKLIQAVVDRQPDNAGYLSTLACALEANGLIADAIRADERILNMEPPDSPLVPPTAEHLARLKAAKPLAPEQPAISP